MSKQLQSGFLSQWLIIQVFGAIALAIATQAIATLLILILKTDNIAAICLFRGLACLFSSAVQGYLQWYLLKQTIKTLDRRWIYTAIAGLPINILNWGIIHLGINNLILDKDGTVFVILAIVGAVIGGANGYAIGSWQKSLFKKSLYWRSLWHDWDREQLLAGALSGVIATVILIGAVFVCDGNWIYAPLSALICSIGLGSISHVMYGLIVGDTIQDVFKQAKLIQ